MLNGPGRYVKRSLKCLIWREQPGQDEPATVSALRIKLLGGFEARSGSGKTLVVPTRKMQVLLAYLAVSGARPVPRQRLLALLWSNRSDEQARNSLRHALSALRRALSGNGTTPLRVDRTSAALDPGLVEVDVRRFERLLDEGGRGALQRAADLYRGDLLAGLVVRDPAADEWLFQERERLRGRAVDALDRLLALQTREGVQARAVETARKLLSLDPFQEPAHRALMAAFAASGQRSQALRQYRICRELLRRELDVEPEAATEKLYRSVRDHGHAVASPAQGEPESAAHPDPPDASGRSGSEARPAQEAPPQASPADAAEAATGPGELRPVTVLVVSLAELSDTSIDLDPEEVSTLFERYVGTVRDAVARYEGAVQKQLADTVMALFGMPVAHGNDAERAVRAAGDLHRAIAALSDEVGTPLKARIGIASGQVATYPPEGGERGADLLAAGAMNLAPRLTHLAAPGETVISDPVYRAVAERVEVEESGGVELRSQRRSVKAWRIRALCPQGRATHRRRFVGRRSELVQLRSMVTLGRDEAQGQAVYIRGEAGIGKTRLVEELMRTASEQGYSVHRSVVLDFGSGKGQDPVRALVRSLLSGDAEADAARCLRSGESLIEQGALSADQRVFLNDLLDLPQPNELKTIYDAMDDDARNEAKRKLVADLVRVRGRQQPQLLIVEDVHWADDLTLAHLAALAPAVRDCAAVLVLTTRLEQDRLDKEWRGSAGRGPLTTIDLGPLSEEEAATLASEFLDPSLELTRRCLIRAAGNPLFLEQLLYSAGDGDDERVPDSIQSLVLARVDRLAARDRNALQAASVLGQRFSLQTLRHVFGDGDYACDALISSYLVQPDGGGLRFAHALIRDAVYASLLNARKRTLHERAAEWFSDKDPVLQAQHLAHAEHPAAPAVHLRAARQLADQYRLQGAMDLTGQGLALATSPADRHALLALRGELHHDLGDIDASIGDFRSALEVAGDDAQRREAWLGLAAGLRVKDDYAQALEALARAERASGGPDCALDRARLHHLRGNLLFPLGDIEGCLREHRLALEHARESGSLKCEAQALGGLADAEYARGHLRSAGELYAQCVELSRRHGFGRIEVANKIMAAYTKLFLNEPHKALDESIDTIAAAAKVGHRRAEIVASIVAAEIFLDLDQHERAAELLNRAQALIERLGAGRFLSECLLHHARLRRAQGRIPEATELALRAESVSRKSGFAYVGPGVLGFLGLLSADPQTRRAYLERGQQALEAGAVGHNYLWFYRFAIEASLQARDWDAAERFADALAGYTRAEPLPWSDFVIAWARALAAHGRALPGTDHRSELLALREKARQINLRWTLPALEHAIRERQMPAFT